MKTAEHDSAGATAGRHADGAILDEMGRWCRHREGFDDDVSLIVVEVL
jgi:hypothetical protein